MFCCRFSYGIKRKKCNIGSGGSAPFVPIVYTRVWIWSCARAWSSTPQLDSTIIPAVENCSGNPRNGGVEIHKNGIPCTYVERSGVSHTPFSKRNFHGESLCGECLWISTARNDSKFLSTPIVVFLSLYTVHVLEHCRGCSTEIVERGAWSRRDKAQGAAECFIDGEITL